MSSAKSGQMKSVRLGRTLACHEVKSQVFISQVLTDSEEATLRDELTCRFFVDQFFSVKRYASETCLVGCISLPVSRLGPRKGTCIPANVSIFFVKALLLHFFPIFLAIVSLDAHGRGWGRWGGVVRISRVKPQGLV